MQKIKFIGMFFLMCLTSGCISYNIDNLQPDEYGLDNSFTDRIYDIYCSSSSYKLPLVDYKCKGYIAELAYNKGYKYFILANAFPLSHYSNYIIYGKTDYNFQQYVLSYNSAKYSNYYVFILINDNDIHNYAKYSKVADYYPIQQFYSGGRRKLN
ncbi:MAG: hypothetical protein LBQ34_00135 [Alphaproteobacteria bacterium]|jgi:hypothetical protein|nr:hypothetical protein [Alphaproteobacteria bacterium]